MSRRPDQPFANKNNTHLVSLFDLQLPHPPKTLQHKFSGRKRPLSIQKPLCSLAISFTYYSACSTDSPSKSLKFHSTYRHVFSTTTNIHTPPTVFHKVSTVCTNMSGHHLATTRSIHFKCISSSDEAPHCACLFPTT